MILYNRFFKAYILRFMGDELFSAYFF